MLLLPNCEVHMGKYLDRRFEVRTERITIILYSHNQHLGFIPDKMILNWIIMTIFASNSFSSIFIRILPEYFSIPLSHLKRSSHSKNQSLLQGSLSSILFVDWSRPSISRSNTLLWRSNTALDGPLINQSYRLFLSGYTIMYRTGLLGLL